MKKYKTIVGPAAISVTGKNSYQKAVEEYAAIINREAAQGWEIELIQQIPLVEYPGCLAAFFGKKAKQTYINMLIFSKDAKDTEIQNDIEEYSQENETDTIETPKKNADVREPLDDKNNEKTKYKDWGHGLSYVATPASPELIEEYNRLNAQLNKPLTNYSKRQKLKKRIEQLKEQIWS